MPGARLTRDSPRRRPSARSFFPLKFAAQVNRLTVWRNENQLYDVLVRGNQVERHTLHQSSPRTSGDIEETEFYRLSIRRHLPFKASPISGVAIMGREQTIPFHVEHRALMDWGSLSISIRR